MMFTDGGSHIDGRVQDPNTTDEIDADPQTPLLKRSPPPECSSVSRRISSHFQNWWLWEIVSAGTAALSIIAIIIILVAFDQRSLPDWPSVFTVRSFQTHVYHLPLRFA